MNISINNRNPGIVPPWLTEPAKSISPSHDSGFVPPWLTDDKPLTPNAAVTTSFVRTPAPLSPPNLRAALLLNA